MVRGTKSRKVSGAGGIAAILLLLAGPGTRAGEVIEWYADGDARNVGITNLDRDPTVYGTVTNSLFPTLPGSFSANSITVHGDVAAASGAAYQGGNVYGALVYDRNATADAADDLTGNVVNINGGTAREVLGAMIEIDNAVGSAPSILGSASGNRVFVTNGATVAGVYGGSLSTGSSGVALKGDASDNEVLVRDATTSVVYGGSVRSTSVGAATEGSADNNTVTLDNATVGGSVYGGYIAGPGGVTGTANDNTVTIMGNTVFTGSNPGLFGGVVYAGSSTGYLSAQATGNTLNLHTPVTVAYLSGFEYYNFYVPADLAAGAAMITVTRGAAYGTDTVDLSGTTVNVGIEGSASALQSGDTITLIATTNGIVGMSVNDTASGTGMQGVIVEYEFDLTTDGQNLYATVAGGEGPGPGPNGGTATAEAKGLPYGMVASLALINAGADLAVNGGFAAAAEQIALTGGGSRPSFFSAIGGGHSRAKTGSHVDLDSISALLGAGWSRDAGCGTFMFGAFLEAGYGDYDTRGGGSLRGGGDNRYFGGGLMARQDWTNGFYTEVSARAGGVKNKFRSDNAVGGLRATYDVTTPYWGAHGGVGYKWSITDCLVLDLSTKYLWSRQNGDSATVTGVRVHFDAVDSHRWRTGARLSYAANAFVKPYVGAAFEYEFDGKSRANALGLSLGAPRLRGGTGIGEAGLAFQRDRFSADLGVQGHLGRRDGIAGNFKFGWAF